MKAPWILYLHGFTSGPQSHKARALHARMRERGLGERFVCPQLPASPAAAMRLAEKLLAGSNHDVDTLSPPVTLVGSSLGGYYATWLAVKHKLNAVLVNPAVASAISLEKYLGPQRWLYSGEDFVLTRQHLNEMRAIYVPTLASPKQFWLLVEEGDETLDYRDAVTRYAGARQTVLPGGDHSFTRWDAYLDEILSFGGLT